MQLVLALALLVSLPSVASAEARIALLIGNKGYSAKVGPLQNPFNDITLIGAALEKLNFNVTLVRDADYRSTNAAIKRHIAALRCEGQGAISLFYYSGHGAANPQTKVNYLIPVDVADADDKDLWLYSINLNTLVENLRTQAPAATHYVVFDACRNELNLARRGQKALTEKGFVAMAYTPGVLIVYATAPGGTASDNGTGAGTYAKALADEIIRPGVESMLVFTRVARRVQQEIGQDPFLSASTIPEIYFAGTVLQQSRSRQVGVNRSARGSSSKGQMTRRTSRRSSKNSLTLPMPRWHVPAWRNLRRSALPYRHQAPVHNRKQLLANHLHKTGVG
jgi:Caspase domain